MSRQLLTPLWLVPIGVIISVLASLAAVWLLSHVAGFRFMPELVSALSGCVCAVMVGMYLWRNRS